MQPHHLRENGIRLLGGTGRRIAQLSSQNKKWLALNQKLSTRPIDANPSTPFRLAVSTCEGERTQQRNGNPAFESQAPLRCLHNIHHSQPLPNHWQFWLFRHFKI